jgi:hypothetical protein
MTASAPDGDGGAGERHDQLALAGAVRRVDDDRQVRQRVHHRHGADVQGVAGGGLEGPDAALAQHDVEVAALGDVLGGHQPLLVRRGQPALEHHRLAHPADRLQQREVLHVAGADLQHVGVLRDDRDVLGVDDLGDDRAARCARAPRRGSPGPSRPSPWKAYGEVPRLVRPPRSIVAPAATAMSAAAKVCSAVSTAHGPGDEHEGVGADVHVAALADR